MDFDKLILNDNKKKIEENEINKEEKEEEGRGKSILIIETMLYSFSIN